ncbi:MAG: signal peptidase I [Firmicutes bacterium HGW-Firmicutes-13]|nr:MAG: signal peptidase I [Firmicutes bacterium HGW-Firmicutes-13]
MSETKNELWEWIKSIIIAVIIALIIRAFVVEIFVVEGHSMLPTLENHERLIVNKFIYHLKEPSYGDIIVFSYSPERDFIKRIMAKGGDTIRVRNQMVYRNGEPLEEKYINSNPVSDFGPVTVPENHVFVMGDNRNNSMDSRESVVGFISMERIKGKAVVIFWPVDKFSLVNS